MSAQCNETAIIYEQRQRAFYDRPRRSTLSAGCCPECGGPLPTGCVCGTPDDDRIVVLSGTVTWTLRNLNS